MTPNPQESMPLDPFVSQANTAQMVSAGAATPDTSGMRCATTGSAPARRAWSP